MSWHSRGGAAAALALLVVLFAGPAQHASAEVDAPIDRGTWNQQMQQRMYGSRVPGSVLTGASRAATTIQRIAGAKRSVGKSAASGGVVVSHVPGDAPASGKKFGVVGKVAGGIGTAASAAFGVDLVYSAFTGGLGSGFGFAGLTGYQSQGLVCDLMAFSDPAACAPVLDPSLLPNFDVIAVEPGWTTHPIYVYTDGPNVWIWTAEVSQLGPGLVQGTLVRDSPYVHWRSSDLFLRCRPLSSAPMSAAQAATVTDRLTIVGQVNDTTTGVGTCPSGQVVNNVEFGIQSGASNVMAHWYPEDNPHRPADTSNPQRLWRTTYRCEGGDVQAVESAPYRETDETWPTPVEPDCGGSGLLYVKVEQMTGGLVTGLLYEWEMPDELDDFAQQYPQCADGSCILELSRIDAATGARLACFDNPEACLGWFQDPAKQDLYECSYGGNVLDLSECYVYAPTFDPAKRTAGGTFADPETGAEAGAVPPAPGGGDIAGCPPPFEFSLGGIGYWVWKGAGCAIQSAFQPRDHVLNASKVKIEGAMSGGTIGVVSDSWDGLSSLDMSGGCGVLVETSPEVFMGDSLRVDTCGEFWSSWGAIRNIIGVGFLIGSVWAGSAVIMRAFGIYIGDRKGDEQ